MNAPSILIFASVLLAHNALAAAIDDAWHYRQEFTLTNTGLVRIHLPLETLNTLRPSLTDLRLTDADGREVPYAVIQPVPTAPVVRPAANFRIEMRPTETVIELETGITQPLSGLTLATPALSFLKAVRVEGSSDGRAWTPLVRGVPIFHQPNGASQLHVSLPRNVWARLRVIVDDRTTKPLPFTGATLYAATGIEPPLEDHPVAIVERVEEAGETSLLLDLGAPQLRLASLSLAVSDAIFRRPVMLSVRREADGVTSEQPLGTATIYRINVDDQPAVSQTEAVYELSTPARQLALRIRNDDSPPLRITNIVARCRSLDLAFNCEKPGRFSLHSGNKLCPPARYDIAALKTQLNSVALIPVVCLPLQTNTAWRKPELLPSVAETGAKIDVKPWRFRKKVPLEVPGVQQFELDREILSQTAGQLADLRLVRNGQQIPFVIAGQPEYRSFPIAPGIEYDAKNPSLGRWQLNLEYQNLPLTEIRCTASGPIFQRDLVLYEVSLDSRSGRRILGGGRFARAAGQNPTPFVITLHSPPQTDKVFLETENGDNTPIVLEHFEAFYRTSRILFKTSSTEDISLYYGNAEARAPQYDLNMVSSELGAAEKNRVYLGKQEQLRKLAWHERTDLGGKGTGGWILWSVLALVVVGLLAVMARLVPKPQTAGDQKPQ